MHFSMSQKKLDILFFVNCSVEKSTFGNFLSVHPEKKSWTEISFSWSNTLDELKEKSNICFSTESSPKKMSTSLQVRCPPSTEERITKSCLFVPLRKKWLRKRIYIYFLYLYLYIFFFEKRSPWCSCRPDQKKETVIGMCDGPTGGVSGLV